LSFFLVDHFIFADLVNAVIVSPRLSFRNGVVNGLVDALSLVLLAMDRSPRVNLKCLVRKKVEGVSSWRDYFYEGGFFGRAVHA
jgi:hypothetical protein